MPYPVTDLGKILTVLGDVLFVLNQLIVHLLDQVRSLITQLRQMHNSILYKIKPVDLILDTHIKWRCDSSLLQISVYGELRIVAVMRQLMDQCRITVEGKDNRRILCKDRIKFTVAQAM